MRPEVKSLEYHSKLGAQRIDFSLTRQACPHLDMAASNPDLAFVRLFQGVETAHERTFSRTTAAKDRDDVAAFGGKGHSLDNLKGPNRFFRLRTRNASLAPGGVVLRGADSMFTILPSALFAEDAVIKALALAAN